MKLLSNSDYGSLPSHHPITSVMPWDGNHPTASRILIGPMCAIVAAISTSTMMGFGHIVLREHTSGFHDVSTNSSWAVGAVGGAFVNGLFILFTIICGTCHSPTTCTWVAHLIAGYCTTIVSSCLGVAILHHIPGGTLDISHAICAAVVGYSIIYSWALLGTICLVINETCCSEFTNKLHLYFT
jgi:hypothetical protein